MGVNFVATFVALALVDRAGRRPLMICTFSPSTFLSLSYFINSFTNLDGVGIMLACEIVMTAIFGASATSGTVSSTVRNYNCLSSTSAHHSSHRWDGYSL